MKSTLARNTGTGTGKASGKAAALLAALAATLTVLAGCGQTGPLYMPKPPVKQTPVPVPPHLPSASSPAAQ